MAIPIEVIVSPFLCRELEIHCVIAERQDSVTVHMLDDVNKI
jgi:hypothetical protein